MSKNNPHDRSITVVVKAKDLFNYPTDITKQVVDDYTSLVEDGGLESRFGDSNKDFETIVFMNKNICWSIETADPNGEDRGYSVELVKVFHNPTPGNPNFFTSDPLNVNQRTGKVCGTISRSPILPDMDDNYTIEFVIGHSTGPNQGGMVRIDLDPKLKISAGQ